MDHHTPAGGVAIPRYDELPTDTQQWIQQQIQALPRWNQDTADHFARLFWRDGSVQLELGGDA